MSAPRKYLEKSPTGISGFDELSEGGLPRGRAVVISGTAGSGKTVFGLEFLYRGIVERGEGGVFVTFEEGRDDLVREVAGFGWDLEALERRGSLAFVDASGVAEHQIEVGEYDFSALAARIRYAVRKAGAKRVVIDSIAALFLRYKDQSLVRRELFKIIAMLRALDVTAVITAERVQDDDSSSRFGVEDFVADSVIFLYNSRVGRERERQIEIVKLRGASHQTGRHSFLIGAGGISVFPGVGPAFAPVSPTERLSIGVDGIDAMLSGGLYRGSTTLLLGPSGTGRTVLGLQFLAEGVRRRERGILFSFEEGKAQLFTDARSIGRDLKGAERRKLLHVDAWQPHSGPLESFLEKIKKHVVEFAPKRVVIDSLTTLAQSADEQRFRRFIVSLNSFLKSRFVTTIVNHTAAAGLESSVAAESDIAAIVDNIIVMKLTDAGTAMEREILIVKSRASAHDQDIRRYTITGRGMQILGDDLPRIGKKKKRTRRR